MGTWGTGFFDNDTACDWGYELVDSADMSVIEQAFNRVIKAGDAYLEAPEAEEALAAAEVVARLQGNWGPRNAYTETVDAWVEEHAFKVPGELISKAKAVIRRVVSTPSELLELWQETPEFEDWKALVDQLEARVGS